MKKDDKIYEDLTKLNHITNKRYVRVGMYTIRTKTAKGLKEKKKNPPEDREREREGKRRYSNRSTSITWS